MIVPTILCGGAGTRLWPVSRRTRPKPFMALPDGESLLGKTLRRSECLEGVERILTVTNRDLYFSTRDEYAAYSQSSCQFDYLLEPMGRNTAPAIAMAARHLLDQGLGEVPMLVLAADHLMSDQAAFEEAVADATALAEQDYLATFGIQPAYAEIGYGYIQAGEAVSGLSPGCRSVTQFVEKPDLATAESYLASGEFLWNSGMFCFKPRVFLEALAVHAEALFAGVESVVAASDLDATPLEFDESSFAAMPNVSVDVAVMEQADKVAVVECDPGWSDIGSWQALSGLQPADEDGNRVVGEVILEDTHDCFVQSSGRLVTTLGVSELMIVDTADALMVADRNRSQDVKRLVDRLKANKDERADLHTTVHRPWGTYRVIEEGPRFKMKTIVVHPGETLSLQMHNHRSEHWVVVSGTAKVVNGDKEFLVRTNESTYIPIGNQHRLSNPGVIDLMIVEVQCGDYLEEDDIVRFDDVYGRAGKTE